MGKGSDGRVSKGDRAWASSLWADMEGCRSLRAGAEAGWHMRGDGGGGRSAYQTAWLRTALPATAVVGVHFNRQLPPPSTLHVGPTARTLDAAHER